MTESARRIISALRLEPLPEEGGFFRQTWRTDGGSAILFLITREHFSALHRIAQDELWHFHVGDAVDHLQLGAGEATVTRLGGNIFAGEQPQLVVPRGTWQGARLADESEGFALLGCTVTPAWDPRGFELGQRAALQGMFPAHAEWIRALTR